MIEQILIAIDQLVNACMGGFSDETISARLYRNRNRSAWWNAWYWLVNIVFLNKNHCYESFIAECERKQLPKAYRESV